MNVEFARIVPVTPVPGTAARKMGVSGKPLPAVICVAKAHSLNSTPCQPLNSVFPPSPMPLVYCSWTVKRCR